MYGITTGIGEFSEVTLNPDQTKEFQKLLIYSHAAGIGKPMDVEIVRGAMCGRINVHSKGHSGGGKETEGPRIGTAVNSNYLHLPRNRAKCDDVWIPVK